MNVPTRDLAQALESALQTITTANGYNTDLGANVYRGFYASALNSSRVNYPFIAIQPESEQVTDRREAKSKLQATFRLILVTDDVANPTDSLYAAVYDTRKALATELAESIQRLGVDTDPAIGETEYAITSDSKLTLATVAVAFTFVENYGA